MNNQLNISIIPKEDYKEVPWKNGLGVTTELLAISHPTKNYILWRVSIASVVNDGEFSDFSGYDRHLLLLEGNGIFLKHDNKEVSSLNNIYDIAHFSGSSKTVATLKNGKIKDFNVITLNSKFYAKLHICKQESTLNIKSEHTLLYSNESNILISDDLTIKEIIQQRDLVHVKNSVNSKIKIKGTNIIVIEIFSNK